MKRRIDLQSYQEYLSHRLMSKHEQVVLPPFLGFGSEEEPWLIPLTDTGGVHLVQPIVALPFADPSHLGLTNLRGAIYSVTDWARFLGGVETKITKKSRFLLLGKNFSVNIAILVSRIIGLFELTTFVETEEAKYEEWCAKRLYDAEGRCWRLLAADRLIGVVGE